VSWFSGWNWKHGQTAPDDAKAGLTFTDVIFGLVITQIFMQGLHYRHLRAEVLVHLVLALTVVLGSYLGYRRSKKRGELQIYFFSLALIRFLIDLAMIFCYFLLASTPDLSANPEIARVSSRFDANVLLAIFILYLVWDLLSAWMKHADYKGVSFSVLRTGITGIFLVLSGVVAVFASAKPRNSTWAITFDSVLIALTILYRFLKDSAPAPDPPAAKPAAQA
jgi:hypothetical protein